MTSQVAESVNLPAVECKPIRSPVERLNWGLAVAAYGESFAKAPASAIRISWTLAYRCNSRTGQLNPSYERITADVRISRSIVAEGIRWLLDTGFLTHVRGRGRRSTRYFLTLPESVVVRESGLLEKESESVVVRNTGRSSPESRPYQSGIPDSNREEQGKNRGKTRAREDPSRESASEEAGKPRPRSTLLTELVAKRNYLSYCEPQWMELAREVGVSTNGVERQDLKAFLEDRIERMQNGATLKDLTDERSARWRICEHSDLAYMLQPQFGEDAPRRAAEIYSAYLPDLPQRDIDAEVVKLLPVPDKERSETIVDRLEARKVQKLKDQN